MLQKFTAVESFKNMIRLLGPFPSTIHGGWNVKLPKLDRRPQPIFDIKRVGGKLLSRYQPLGWALVA